MRSAGWFLSVALTPLVLVGVALTVSVFGAVFGVPLLALVGRPWWTATAIGLGRQGGDLSGGARVHVVVCVVVLVIGCAGAVAVGAGDLDSAEDLVLSLSGAGLVGLAVVGAARLLRLDARRHQSVP